MLSAMAPHCAPLPRWEGRGVGRLNGLPHAQKHSPLLIERLGIESLSVNMLLLVIIGFQLSLWKEFQWKSN